MTRTTRLALVCLAPACGFDGSQREVQTEHFAGPITAIAIDHATGDLTIRGADRTDADLRIVRRWDGPSPTVSWELQGATLVIVAECPATGRLCDVDLTLDAPHDATTSLVLGVGSVDLRDLSGSVDVDAGVGDLTLFGLGGGVIARTGVGDVTATGLTGDTVIVRGGTGSIDLTHVGAFSAIDAETSTGDVDVTVPDGTYAVTATSSVGTVTVDGLVDDPGATSTIRAVTSVGSVHVTGTGGVGAD